MTSSISEGDEVGDPILAATNAAAIAASDAAAAAEAAAVATLVAQEAVTAAADVATSAGRAMASVVSTAASSADEIASLAASHVALTADRRAFDVAATAEAALETAASARPSGLDSDDPTWTAISVAATVAADVLGQAKATAEAAATVAAAVADAARDAAGNAKVAADTVDLAAGAVAAAGRAVARASAASEAASAVVVDSTARVTDLASRLHVVAANRRAGVLRRAPLAAELQDAVTGAELRLHYQPIYDIPTGEVVAVEALLRWQHPVRGLLLPGDFLDLSEGRPFVDPIGDWVLGAAIAQAARWRRSAGEHSPRMWVNISCEQLGKRRVAGVVADLLSSSGLAPANLGLEVTERHLIRSLDTVASDMAELRELGVGLAVDDFGTGYASLDYLRKFEFDEIKIDKAFVAGLGHDRTNTAVTASIIALAHVLELDVVAEGVEAQSQHDLLRELGCGKGQGYLMQRPAPADVITPLVLAGR